VNLIPENQFAGGVVAEVALVFMDEGLATGGQIDGLVALPEEMVVEGETVFARGGSRSRLARARTLPVPFENAERRKRIGLCGRGDCQDPGWQIRRGVSVGFLRCCLRKGAVANKLPHNWRLLVSDRPKFVMWRSNAVRTPNTIWHHYFGLLPTVFEVGGGGFSNVSFTVCVSARL